MLALLAASGTNKFCSLGTPPDKLADLSQVTSVAHRPNAVMALTPTARFMKLTGEVSKRPSRPLYAGQGSKYIDAN
ncbi:hypothetical protein [Achromobacter sp.]|uniref:hypothetical protein n=1 Tax=Achromobacter sp. TaxID=134375 RepID=UPI0028AF9728|nr:hypothetical protein [Achromobacter sp.]